MNNFKKLQTMSVDELTEWRADSFDKFAVKVEE